MRNRVMAGLNGALAMVCVLSVPVRGQDVTMEHVLSALERRQERVHSAKFVCAVRYAYPQGSLPRPAYAGPVPPKDAILEHEYTLWMDGDKVRIDNEGNVWSFDQGEFVPERMVTASDGQSSWEFRPSVTAKRRSEGTIYDKSECRAASLMNYKPFFGTYRLRYLLGSDRDVIEEAWVLAGQEEVGGVECVVLKKSRGGGREVRCYLTPEKDFSLVRFSLHSKGRMSRRIDVTHSRDDSHGWVPATWQISKMNTADGTLGSSFAATVTDYSINSPIDPGLFQMNFPVGTVVLDHRAGRDEQ